MQRCEASQVRRLGLNALDGYKQLAGDADSLANFAFEMKHCALLGLRPKDTGMTPKITNWFDFVGEVIAKRRPKAHQAYAAGTKAGSALGAVLVRVIDVGELGGFVSGVVHPYMILVNHS
jgi:hypothetical protein